MQQALRHSIRDDGFNRLRQLWLAWLALVAAMLALTHAPRPLPPLLALPCPAHQDEAVTQAIANARFTRETTATPPRHSCIRRAASTAARTSLQKNIQAEKTSTRQILPTSARVSSNASAPAHRPHPHP